MAHLHRLKAGQKGMISVLVTDAGLQKTQLLIFEGRNGLLQKIRWRQKVRIKNREEIALRMLNAMHQIPRLVTRAIGSLNTADRHTLLCQLIHLILSQQRGLIRGVIQHQDFQGRHGVIQSASCIDQALHDCRFVIDRQ